MKRQWIAALLKAVIIGCFVCGLFVICVVLPWLLRALAAGGAGYGRLYTPALALACVSAVPVCAALCLLWRVFGDIGLDRSFSAVNARRFLISARLAAADTLLYALAFVYLLAFCADLVFAMFAVVLVAFSGCAFTVLFYALSRLLAQAAALKEENDYTI